LQEYLGSRNGGYFTNGSQMHSDLAPDDRAQIAQRLALFDITLPTSSRLRGGPSLLRVKSLEPISVKTNPPLLQNFAGAPAQKNGAIRRIRSNTDASAFTLGAEIREQRVLTIDEILRRFQDINNDIRTLCDQCVDQINHTRHPPVTKKSWVVPRGHPLSDLAADSVSADDFVYFTMLSIINRELYHTIFLPFHPAVAEDKTRPYGRQLQSGEQIAIFGCESLA
jgi:hypothetical protein